MCVPITGVFHGGVWSVVNAVIPNEVLVLHMCRQSVSWSVQPYSVKIEQRAFIQSTLVGAQFIAPGNGLDKSSPYRLFHTVEVYVNLQQNEKRKSMT
jgi:hypothetical protein